MEKKEKGVSRPSTFNLRGDGYPGAVLLDVGGKLLIWKLNKPYLKLHWKVYSIEEKKIIDQNILPKMIL